MKADDDKVEVTASTGSIFFVGAGTSLELKSDDDDFTVFRAYCLVNYAKL